MAASNSDAEQSPVWPFLLVALIGEESLRDDGGWQRFGQYMELALVRVLVMISEQQTQTGM